MRSFLHGVFQAPSKTDFIYLYRKWWRSTWHMSVRISFSFWYLTRSPTGSEKVVHLVYYVITSDTGKWNQFSMALERHHAKNFSFTGNLTEIQQIPILSFILGFPNPDIERSIYTRNEHVITITPPRRINMKLTITIYLRYCWKWC
jgi:hypothetical protein